MKKNKKSFKIVSYFSGS